MDREILFRGKRADNGKWIEGYYCKTSDTTYAFAEDYDRHPVPEHHCILVDEMTDWGLPNRPTLYEVDPATVGEYTGLKDRNGKRIFEGDIIKVPWMNEYRNRFVYYKNGLFKADSIDGFFSASLCSFVGFDLPKFHCEVIGNIHDNPELMEESE